MPTYEETKKFAYTHGLEKIYSLEAVDIKTVRPVASQSKKPVNETNYAPIPKQLDFFIWNKSHPLLSHFSLLTLSSTLSKHLRDLNVQSIADAMESLPHLPETERLQIKTAVNRFLLKTVFIQEYQIQLKAFLKMPKEQYLSSLQQFGDSSLLPWVRSRYGLVKRYELEEFIQNYTEEEDVPKMLSELEEKHGLFEHLLTPLEDHLFCSGNTIKQNFLQIIEIAKSYFYKKEIRYPLDTLIQYLVKESLLSPERVEKILRSTSKYTIERGKTNLLEIYESNGRLPKILKL